MIFFEGKKEAERILEETKKKIEQGNLSPTLAIVRAGNNPEVDLYIRNKKKAAHKIGIKIFSYSFSEKTSEYEIIDKIRELNEDVLVDGIIIQLPLPEKVDTSKVISSVDPKKDVDGFHEVNRRLLKSDNPYFLPVLPLAIMKSIESATEELEGKKIVTLCNSDIFGNTIENFFQKNKIDSDYILVNSKSISQIKPDISSADIVISVCGKPRFIKGYMVKKGSILIDAGIKFFKKGVIGDIDQKSVEEKASFITPVPGGIGPLTVAYLLKNVYLAAKNDSRRK
jgi:5,10-methylene-tetrahydrofolate dehydrogenase/methenyl tetrahydrofolate cyclohydrolase